MKIHSFLDIRKQRFVIHIHINPKIKLNTFFSVAVISLIEQTSVLSVNPQSSCLSFCEKLALADEACFHWENIFIKTEQNVVLPQVFPLCNLISRDGPGQVLG